MSVIIKDMNMLKGCRSCKYCSYHHILHLYECKLTGSQMIPYSYKRRDQECPLQEVNMKENKKEQKKEKEKIETFYYCYVYGNNAPRVTHATYELALNEAKRLVSQNGGSVQILQCVGIVTVEPKVTLTTLQEAKL